MNSFDLHHIFSQYRTDARTNIILMLFQTHRWLVSSCQDQQADLQVTFDPSREVVGVTQQQPLPQEAVSCREGGGLKLQTNQ